MHWSFALKYPGFSPCVSRRHLRRGQLSEGHRAMLSLQRGHSWHHGIRESRINLTDALHYGLKEKFP